MYCFQSRPHTYYIEVSVDQQNWIRIINYEDYYCRSKQSLWIHSQVVQFVRIVGDSIGCFFVFHLKIMYKTYGMDLIEIKERGILCKYSKKSTFISYHIKIKHIRNVINNIYFFIHTDKLINLLFQGIQH